MYELITSPALERAQWRTRLHGPKPEPCYLYFTKEWTDAHKWCRDRYFEITHTVLVNYDKGYIIPGDDYKDIDLSSEGIKIYPESEGIVYEILVGLKPGNYQVGIYIPGPRDYLLALGHTTMYPDIEDPNKRYLAKISPEDSPYENPLLKLWAIKDMAAWILKIYVHPGVSFEKVILSFKIAKHRVVEIQRPDVFTTIRYFTEIKGTW